MFRMAVAGHRTQVSYARPVLCHSLGHSKRAIPYASDLQSTAIEKILVAHSRA